MWSTIYTDAHVLNWPAGAAVRVLRNSLVDELGHRLTGHDPDLIPREKVATEEGRPLLKFSTDSFLRIITGDFDAMALYAGQSAAFIDRVPSAAKVIARIMAEAEAEAAQAGSQV